MSSSLKLGEAPNVKLRAILTERDWKHIVFGMIARVERRPRSQDVPEQLARIVRLLNQLSLIDDVGAEQTWTLEQLRELVLPC